MKRTHLLYLLTFLTCLSFACNSTLSEKAPSEKPEIDIINATADSSTITTEATEDVKFKEEIESLAGLKFKVDDVMKNDSLLETFSAEKVLANFIGKEITYSPNSNDTLLELVPISGNGLLNTINICYGQHRPLVLSPDVIWMTIAQGVSTHINKDFKNLEGILFKKPKPKVLRVRNDSLEFGSKHWKDLILSLSDSTKKYTQEDMFTFLAPKFSTTTQEIHTAYQANILYGCKKAFTYVGEGGCGIPYITITGTQSDWLKIKSSLKKLDELGLGHWRKELGPIIDEFISVYNNDRNDLFWKNIYKEFTDYGEYSISGWIVKFYPYLEILGEGTYDEETHMSKVEHKFVNNDFIDGDKYLYSTLNIDDFPNYKSETTIIWVNHFKEETTKMSLYSGIMGAKQYPDGSLKPWVTWAISSENEPESGSLRSKTNAVIHKDPKWIPHIYTNDSKVAQQAVYPVKENIQFDESVLTFQEELTEIYPSNNSNKSDTLLFYILSNGKPLIITDDKKMELTIQAWIDKNGIKWEPAKARLSEIIYLSDDMDSSKLVRVNSKFEIILPNK